MTVIARNGEANVAPHAARISDGKIGSRADETELRQALPLYPQQRKESLQRKIFGFVPILLQKSVAVSREP
jgi:hypothetical protein